MHRRSSGRRSRKSGYKLKLNPQLAHLRTVRGWVTKHEKRHYHIHAADAPGEEGGSEKTIQDLIDERARELQEHHASTRRLIEQARSALGPNISENDPRVAEFAAKARMIRDEEYRRQREELSTRTEGRLHPKLVEQANRELRDRGEITDETRSRIERSLSRPSREEPFSGYSEEGSVAERSILNQISREVNPNPNSSPKIPPSLRDEAERQIKEEGKLRPETRERVRRELSKRRYATLETARKRVRRAFVRPDPLTGKLKRHISKREAELLAGYITTSHHAESAEVRAQAREAAMRLTGKLAQKAATTEKNSTEARRTRALLEDLSTYQGAGGPPNEPPTGGPGGTEPPSPDEFVQRLAHAQRQVKRENRLGGTLEPITLEDHYHFYGHEFKTPPKGSVAERKGKLRAQYEFNKENLKNTAKNLKSGDLVMMWDSGGKRVGKMEDATFAIGPNKKWYYKLRTNPEEMGPDNSVVVPKQVHTKGANNQQESHEIRSEREMKITGSRREGRTGPKVPVREVEEVPSRVPMWKEMDLEYWDKEPRFKRPRLTTRGTPVEGDWDQIQSEQLVQKFQAPFTTKLGKRTVDIGPKPSDVEKDIFVPVKGIKKASTKNIYYGSDKKTGQRLMYQRGAGVIRGGQWLPATQEDWELRRKSGQPESGFRSPSGIAAFETDPYAKHVRVHYVPEGDARLERKEKDQLAIPFGRKKQTVAFTHNGKPVVVDQGRPRAIYLNLDESTDRQKALNHLIFGYSRAKEARELRERSELAGLNRQINRGVQAQSTLDKMDSDPLYREAFLGKFEKQHQALHGKSRFIANEKGEVSDVDTHKIAESHLKSLVAAGASATALGLKKKFRTGYGPQLVNSGIGGVREHSRGIDHLMSKYNVPLLDVNEAYVRPLGEKVANAKFMLSHPLSDPDGETLGVEWGRWRYRKHWINDQTRMQRTLEKRGNEIERVQRTREWFENNNMYSPNPFVRFVAHRREANLRHKDYVNFTSEGGMLDRVAGEVSEIRAQATPDSKLESKAVKLHGRIEQLRMLGGHSQAAHERSSNWTGSMELVTRDTVKEGLNMANKMAEGVNGVGLAGFASRHKGLLIGAGVGALAVGGAYAYHRHRQHQLPEEERTAFYNKALPPKFTLPLPHVRTTGYVRTPSNAFTREFHMDNKRLRARWGLSMEPQEFKFRPVDRGYEPNAKLIGGIKLRGIAPGGQGLGEALTYDPEQVFTRRRNWSSKRTPLAVGGKETPFYLNIGDQRRIKLSRTNPNTMKAADRENIVWAYKGTPEERNVRSFFSHDARLQDMFEDHKEISRIRRKKGTEEVKRFQAAIDEASRRGSTLGARASVTGQERAETGGEYFATGLGQREQDAWDRRTARFRQRGIEWR